MTSTPNGQPFEELVISGLESGPVTVLYPDNFFAWDEVSNYLSATLGTGVLSLHIHDGDLWMYILFSHGREMDHFNPIPDYWSDEVSLEELTLWKGKSSVIARNWPGVDATSIDKYLVTWDLDDDNPEKAYVDDQHTLGDCWQITDFMRKLGLAYPIDSQGWAHGEVYHFEVSPDLPIG